ncbi:hypothetical protein DRE_04628 [Drechslerella stenobrocha 248]|uniref:Uncharacterized protein n=1 Tax=Drechslerella stenobrocha 248 TaxID=1043628 RepID=W7HS88_9PEZI|nr:hypothetical protein DRE_04628 [Drechslerella stenobrocha 248]
MTRVKAAKRTPSPGVPLATPKSQKLIHSSARALTPADRRMLDIEATPSRASFRKAMSRIQLASLKKTTGKRLASTAMVVSPFSTQAGGGVQLSPSAAAAKRRKGRKATEEVVVKEDNDAGLATAAASIVTPPPRRRGRPPRKAGRKAAGDSS